MGAGTNTRRITGWRLDGTRAMGRPQKRWFKDNLRAMGVRGWKHMTRDQVRLEPSDRAEGCESEPLVVPVHDVSSHSQS